MDDSVLSINRNQENITSTKIYINENSAQPSCMNLSKRNHCLDPNLFTLPSGGKSFFPARKESFFVVLADSSALSLTRWSFRCWFCWTTALTKEEWMTGLWWWPCGADFAEGEKISGLIPNNSGSDENLYGSLLSSILRNVMDILHIHKRNEIIEYLNVQD